MERASSQSVEALIDALASARAEIAHIEGSLQLALTRLEVGCTSMDEFLFEVRPHIEGRQPTEVLEVVDAVRRETRLKVFSLALERGYSIVEMARAWGVPRQLATRYVHEAMSNCGLKDGE